VPSFKETFAPVLDVEPEMGAIESSPHSVQAAGASETVLLLSFSFSLAGHATHEGLLTLCYPYSTLQPVLDRLELHAKESPMLHAEGANERVAEHLNATTVQLSVQLRPSLASAAEIGGLQVGDVLRIDHQIDKPALAYVQGKDLIEGYIGRSGKRLGFRVTGWRFEDE
jgi:flagellar motor switch protein FliM